MQFRTSLALVAFLTGEALAACKPRPSSTYVALPSPATTTSPAIATSTAVIVAPTSALDTSTVAPVSPSPSTSATTLDTVIITPTTTSTPSSTSEAASATSSAGTGSGLTADQTNALNAHNVAREEVGEADLAWDAALANDALAWANNLVANQGGSPGTLTHSSGTGQGENLYWQSNGATPFVNAANAWIAEKAAYSGEAISNDAAFETYGHYTQIIWASTNKVGMAAAADGSGGYYVVARYTPQGNIIGQVPTES